MLPFVARKKMRSLTRLTTKSLCPHAERIIRSFTVLSLFQVSTLASWSSIAYVSWYGCSNYQGSPCKTLSTKRSISPPTWSFLHVKFAHDNSLCSVCSFRLEQITLHSSTVKKSHAVFSRAQAHSLASNVLMKCNRLSPRTCSFPSTFF